MCAIVMATDPNVRVAAVADANARHLVAYRTVDEMREAHPDPVVGALHVASADDGRRYVVTVLESSHERRFVVEWYMQDVVLPHLADFGIDASGVYPISFEDGSGAPGVLCFSKRRHQRSVLLPDFYQLIGYDADVMQFARHDPLPFAGKASKMVFAGKSTGDSMHDPELAKKNERIAACLWAARGNADVADFRITEVVQMSEADLLEHHCGGDAELMGSIVGPHVSAADQLRNRYVVSIDGNSSAWDRPVWVMSSNSALLKMRSGFTRDEPVEPLETWYYPLMTPNEHYFDVPNLDALRPTFEFAESNPLETAALVERAKAFAALYCTNAHAHVGYTARLFLAAAEANGR